MNRYEDILCLPYEGLQDRTPMPLADRAAQFAPFSALTGYEDVISETARLTEERRELTEEEQLCVNQALLALDEPENKGCFLEVVYFLPDEAKAGGAFVHRKSRLERILPYEQMLILKDGTHIPFKNIMQLAKDEEGADDL